MIGYNDKHHWTVAPIAFGQDAILCGSHQSHLAGRRHPSRAHQAPAPYKHATPQTGLQGASFWWKKITEIRQAALKAKGNQQRWRILPSDVKYDGTAPKATQGLTATAQTASVLLNWDANTETDLDSYRVLRALADEAEPQWQVIGRQVKETAFVDNSCEMGAKYIYKVQAMDHACNFSKATKTVPEVTATVELPKKDVLVAWYDMENSLYDITENQMDAVVSGTVSYDESAKKLGKQSLVLNGTNTFLQVPATVAGMEEMTIATWVNWKNTSSNWTRIFDFGNGTDEYMFLTPSWESS